MRLFQSRTITPIDSELHDESSFFSAFSKDFKAAKREVVIESPFMTKRRASELAPLCRRIIQKGVSVSIYTRNPSDHDTGLREQALIAMDILKTAGVKVISCNDMRHRKLAIIDGQILWEGSLNMLSHSNSREMMRRSVSEKLCDEMFQFTGIKKTIR